MLLVLRGPFEVYIRTFKPYAPIFVMTATPKILCVSEEECEFGWRDGQVVPV